ncbi:unnamed protein product, partial [Symbiodinium sp. KB8]
MALLLGYVGVLLAKALFIRSHQEKSTKDETTAKFMQYRLDIAQRLSEAIKCKTISYDRHGDQSTDYNELKKLRALIEKSYPLVNSRLEKRIINDYSIVYIWRGTDSSLLPALVSPAMFCAHMDVVPTPDLHKWEKDPFAGEIVDEVIWGRGAIDDKQSVMGLLEVLEAALKEGWQPKRTVYLALGHDEEISGHDGAQQIAKAFAEENIQFEFCLDEGLFLLDGIFPGISSGPVAAVCVAEKGYSVVKLSTDMETGHSSSPPSESALGVLAAAVSNLEKQPLAPTMTPQSAAMFSTLAPHMSWPLRLLAANINRGPIGWLVAKSMARNSRTATTVRTTTAVTVFRSGSKVNVVPGSAEAYVNHRILPNQTVNEILELDRTIVQDDRVKLEVIDSLEASPISSIHSVGYKAIATAVRSIWPNAVVAPSLMVGNTDTRHYLKLCKDVYRFCPTYMRPNDVA